MSAVIVTRKASGPALEYWMSLLLGHTETVQYLLEESENLIHPDSVFDTSDVDEWRNYRYNPSALRIWALTYEEEYTCPLYVTASRGYSECLRLLLRKGADVDFAPGGESALHGACESGQDQCVRLLLRYGANPNIQSQEGDSPLHRCKTPGTYLCAELLLQSGALVNVGSEEEELTPLHVAARHGLVAHVDLYLRYDAAVDKRDVHGETPLSSACSHPQSPEQLDRYHRVCQHLIEGGANILSRDNEQQSPLHLACKSANPQVVELLLEHGAQVNAMSYSGNTPMQNILQVLRYCCTSPRTVEVLLNTYSTVRGSEDWAEVVPEEERQKDPPFFRSVFSLSRSPRCLQHLCRCALRSHLEGRLPTSLPRLPLPTPLINFLQLRIQGVLY
ncbi:ankyrin repeat and SOCS box protein 10 isoform X2 [Engystomops pustulosus]|uniref:ankyrin repeat and SOCS box protein 10 isoform X2 n=1 Tax=Engystomops pustulosus TaxID=76066 RepID=UPI003AFA16B4